MIWKDIMLTSYEQPLFNWKQTLSGIDVEKFKRQYLDPASGYVGVVRCPDREKCSPHECCGLNIRDLSSGTTACCSQRFSGPRMLLYHPVIAIRHLVETQRQKKK